MLMKIIAFLVLLITPLLVLADPEDQEIAELHLGDSYKLTIFRGSDLYFQYKIPENIDLDLIIGNIIYW